MYPWIVEADLVRFQKALSDAEPAARAMLERKIAGARKMLRPLAPQAQPHPQES